MPFGRVCLGVCGVFKEFWVSGSVDVTSLNRKCQISVWRVFCWGLGRDFRIFGFSRLSAGLQRFRLGAFLDS